MEFDIYYSLWTNGWRESSQDLNIWRLSFNLVKKLYPNNKIYLVTDSEGAKSLKGIPFDDVYVLLDSFHAFKKVWSLGKIIAYKKAASNKKPFLHLDADVFLWEKLPEDLLSSEIFAQSEDVIRKARDSEKKSAYDIEHVVENYKDAPNLWKEFVNSDLMMINMGIFGGKNLDLINKYCDLCLEMIFDKKFYDLWAGKNYGEKVTTCLPCMVEQMNLAFFLAKKKKKINLLFKSLQDTKTIPCKYTHLMNLKFDKNILKRIEKRLMTKNFAPNIINLITVVTLGINV